MVVLGITKRHEKEIKSVLFVNEERALSLIVYLENFMKSVEKQLELIIEFVTI